MKIKFATWHWYAQVLAVIAIPVVVLDFSQPAWWTSTISNTAFGVLCVLAGLPCVLFWAKLIRIEFTFSERDKRKMTYRLWKLYCEQFGRSMTDGSKDSSSDK